MSSTKAPRERLAETYNVSLEVADQILMRTFHNWKQVEAFKNDPVKLGEYAQKIAAQGGVLEREFLRDLVQASNQILGAVASGWILLPRNEEIPWAGHRCVEDDKGELVRIEVAAARKSDNISLEEIEERYQDLKAFFEVHSEILIEAIRKETTKYRNKITPERVVVKPVLSS